MTSAEERIKELARVQSLDPADAARLLDAVRPSTSGRRGGVANPFARWSGETTSLLGAVVALFGVATSRLGVRYDGAIDLHVVRGPVAIGVALLDQLLAVGLTALVMWGAARVVSRARFVDVLGAVGLSRAPAVVVAAPLAVLVPLLPHDPTKLAGGVLEPRLLFIVGVIAVLALAGVVAQIWALVVGFRTATGARGGRLAAAVIGGLFAAELAVKLVLAIAR